MKGISLCQSLAGASFHLQSVAVGGGRYFCRRIGFRFDPLPYLQTA
jgi:hypothetical protein